MPLLPVPLPHHVFLHDLRGDLRTGHSLDNGAAAVDNIARRENAGHRRAPLGVDLQQALLGTLQPFGRVDELRFRSLTGRNNREIGRF